MKGEDYEDQPPVHVEDLPGGGSISLNNIHELTYFRQLKQNYVSEYEFTKPNDLSRLGQLLSFELTAYRLTQRMTGNVPTYDSDGKIVGHLPVPAEEQAEIPELLKKVQHEIRQLENALRIDKKAREGAGQHEVRRYMENLKRAANEYGVHLSERYTFMDQVLADASWKIRVLHEGDDSDRKHHDISVESIVEWLEKQVDELKEIDKEFAKNKQSLWVGKV